MKINIELNEQPVRETLNGLLQASRDLSPVMRSIGEHLLNTTRQRFPDERDPKGFPWEPLSPVTLRRKRRNADKVLTESGELSGSINYRVGRDHVDIGSTRVYAGTHQFGASQGAFGTNKRNGPIPWGDIPARPFLGLSDADQTSIVRILNRHLARHLAPR